MIDLGGIQQGWRRSLAMFLIAWQDYQVGWEILSMRHLDWVGCSLKSSAFLDGVSRRSQWGR